MIAKAIYNILVMMFFVLVLSGGFYIIGKFFIKLLRIPNIGSHSFIIAVGISSLIFFSYYVNKLSVPLIYFWLILLCIAITFLIIQYGSKRLLKQIIYPNFKLVSLVSSISLFILLLTLQAMIAFRTVDVPVGTIMNFDIFYWSLLAEHLFVTANFANIIPGGENIIHFLYIDGWGSSLLLALISKLIKSTSIEATSYYTLFFLTLIGLAILELIQKIFNFKKSIAFMLSFLTTGNTFLFFIAYNQFNAEIAATFYYLVGIFVIIHLINQPHTEKLIQTILMMTFPFLGIFLTYQSGFLVFSVFLMDFCWLSLLFIYQFDFKNQLLLKLSYFSIAFSMVILLLMALLPEFAAHTLHRTFFVFKTDIGGWQMPLLSPFILFSIPELGIFPDELSSQLVRYIGAIVILLLLLFLACKITYRLTHSLYQKFIGIVIFFCLSLASYFLLYYIKGNVYQVWKFAAFTILPISFVFLAVLVSPFYYSKNKDRFYKNILFIILATICLCMITCPFKNKKIYLYNDKIEQLTLIKKALHKIFTIQNIVIATDNDNQMLAINLFANEYKLFPLIKAHHFAGVPTMQLIRSLDSYRTAVIVQAECYRDLPSRFTTSQFKVISLNQLFLTAPTKMECINFNKLKPSDNISSEWVYMPSHKVNWV